MFIFSYLEDLKWWPFKSEKCDKHEDQENTSGQLQIFLRLVLSQTWNSWEKGSTFNPWFCQNQKQGSDQGQVPEEELHVPEDAVGDGLKGNQHHKVNKSYRCVHAYNRSTCPLLNSHCKSPVYVPAVSSNVNKPKKVQLAFGYQRHVQ